MSNNIKVGPMHTASAALQFLSLISLLLLSQTLVAVARSVPVPGERVDDKDPMMALPSGRNEQAHQEVQYVTLQQAAGPYAMAEDYAAQPQSQLMAEGQPEQQYEMVQMQPRTSEQSQDTGEDCNQRHEFTAMLDQQAEPAAANNDEPSVSADYAGQLVYVSQGGQEADRLKGAAAAWSQASDLSATILTEVPVKDMPAEGKPLDTRFSSN